MPDTQRGEGHTPGPLEIIGGQPGEPSMIFQDGHRVATVYDYDLARLIAAAPYLLAALKANMNLSAYLGHGIGDINLQAIGAYKLGMAAIKAAEGKG